MPNKKKVSSFNLEITPIAHSSMADKAELRLLELFKHEDFKRGDSLPKETELAESMGVSRNVVREALSRLRMLGIVESKKRRGMILGKADLFSGFERLMDPDILDLDTVREIFEIRLVIEMGLADLLFQRKTEKDLKELQDIADLNALKNAEKTNVEFEVNFHKKLYEMTGNQTLIRFQTMLLPMFHFIHNLEKKEGDKVKKGNVSHQDLINILKNGNAQEFRDSMYEHLSPHFKRVKKW